MTAPLVVAEVFGPTVQGEGPSTGRRCGFLRLSRCNLSCGAGAGATWACDTPYTWDWKGKLGKRFEPAEQQRHHTPDEVAEAVRALGVDLLVVTGGEPLLQQRRLLPLVELLAMDGIGAEVETNGTQVPDPSLYRNVDRLNVSVKLANSGMPEKDRIRPEAIEAIRDGGDHCWKFVASSPADLVEAADLVDSFGLRNVWVMPSGTTSTEVAEHGRAIAEDVIALGWNLSPRWHVTLWNDERGR